MFDFFNFQNCSYGDLIHQSSHFQASSITTTLDKTTILMENMFGIITIWDKVQRLNRKQILKQNRPNYRLSCFMEIWCINLQTCNHSHYTTKHSAATLENMFYILKVRVKVKKSNIKQESKQESHNYGLFFLFLKSTLWGFDPPIFIFLN